MLLPFYLISADWAMIKMLVLFELDMVHFIVEAIFDLIYMLLPYSIKRSTIKSFEQKMTMNTMDVFLLTHAMACFWLRFNEFSDVDNHVETYVSSFYFVYSTATTVGYGDITVDHSNQGDIIGRYSFAVVLMFMALVYFAFMQSLIVNLIDKWDRINNCTVSFANDLEDWLVTRNNSGRGAIPWLLERKIFHYFTFYMRWDIGSVLCGHGFLNRLGFSTKEALREYLAHEIIRKFIFFRDIDPLHRSQFTLTAKLVK